MSKADQFVAAARTWVGAPFRYHGRDRTGIDCVGVVVQSLADVGITLQIEPYGKHVASNAVLEQLQTAGHRIPFVQGRSGDIAVLNYRGESNHIGILTGEGTMIHSLAFAKKVVEHSLSHPHVKAYWVALYRLTCLENS